jgi:hypothetical protein
LGFLTVPLFSLVSVSLLFWVMEAPVIHKLCAYVYDSMVYLHYVIYYKLSKILLQNVLMP